MDRVYTAEASAYGQRTGAVITSDDRLDLQLSRPSEMGGDGGPGTNPEQLFAAGYAACFHSAMRFGVKDVGLTAKDLEGSRGDLGALLQVERAGHGFGSRSLVSSGRRCVY